MEQCRLSGEALNLVIDLGKQPLGNGFLSPNQIPEEYFFQLQCGFNEQSKLLQLINQNDLEKLSLELLAWIPDCYQQSWVNS